MAAGECWIAQPAFLSDLGVYNDAMRILNYVMLSVFLICVAVQYNDPDPIQWMVIYGLAAVCCALFAFDRLPAYVAATTGTAAFLWAFFLLPQVMGRPVPWKEVFATIHMLSPGVEEVREIGGLLIVTFWMVVLFIKSRSFVRAGIR